MSDFLDEMDKLAAQLAADANMAEKAFSDRLDAFKTLMPYYSLLRKQKKDDDGDEEIPSFTNFQNAVRAVK